MLNPKIVSFFRRSIISLSTLTCISCAMSEGPKIDFEIINKVTLDKDLKEISGLTYYKDGKVLAIQDEDGKLFLLDEKSGDVLNTWKFGKKGDYEGLCIVKEDVYIIKSNGDMDVFNLQTKKSRSIRNKNFPKIEFEGICYQSNRNQLILSCKTNKSSKNKNLDFYSFDLATQMWSNTVLFSIHKKDIEENFGMDFSQIKSSGMVQSPLNNHFYIVASIGSVLIELDENYQLIKTRALNSSFKQPEGISINSDGDLLISNEGQKKQKANIFTIRL